MADLRAGRPTAPPVSADVSLELLARAGSWQVRGVRQGIGFDGRGYSCWSIDTVSPTGEAASLVLGISDDDGPVRVAGWGMQPKCRCPSSPSGSLRC